jgi:hypothetical protein
MNPSLFASSALKCFIAASNLGTPAASTKQTHMRTDRPKRDNNNENPTGQKYKQELAVSDTRNVLLLLLCLAVLQYQCQRRTIQQQSTGRERARGAR